MKKLTALIAFFVLNAVAQAAVSLPDFAFTGQELTGFSISPSFKQVSVSFSVQSGFDSYLRQESFELKQVDSKEYKSADPGGMYSGSFGTSLSSVFVGEKAYRNNIVKGYLDKQYLSVIQSYEKYYTKIAKSQYEQEVNLVYAFALLETGSISRAMGIMKDVAYGDGTFAGIASDRIMQYYLDTKLYEEADIFASGLKRVTPYSLYSWLYSLLQLQRYERVVETFDKHSEITSKDKRFYDFLITARYSQGGFDDVIKYGDKAGNNTVALLADSCLVRGNIQCALDHYNDIPDDNMKNVIFGKIAVTEGNYKEAERVLASLSTDEDRLNIFFFYIGRNFPNIDLTFLDKFVFDSKINNDYNKFYRGIYYLSKRDEMNAIRQIDGIIFNRELINTAYYYRGLAYSSIDTDRAQRYFLRFMELSQDEQKLMVSRYMVAQMYYLNGRFDDALMLIQPCETDYCRILKGKIFIDKNDLNSAWKNVDGVRGDEAALVRASILYNRKNYKEALTQLKLITNKSPQSDLLMMLTYLKLGDTSSAGAVFNRNSGDEMFMDAYLVNMMLAGQYQQVLKLTDGNKTKYRLVRSKALFSLGKYQDAAVGFRSIVDSGQHSFDAWYGLLTSYMAMKDDKKFDDAARDITQVRQGFDRKDFLVLQAAKMALDTKDTRLATMLLNHFFDNYDVSVYKRDAYLLRGQLFRDTGRLEQCLDDAQMMQKDGRNDEGLFLKAECLQKSKPADAINIFEDLAKTSDRYRDLSYAKLIGLQTSPKDLKTSVNYFRNKDTGIYADGLEKYFDILPASQLSGEKSLLESLIKEGNPAVLPLAYYYSGMIQFGAKDYESAAATLLKGFYLYPNSKYAAKSVEKAASAYDSLGRKEEADIMRKKLKKN
jgi:predicted negative regulator of RcsB-dependent stress response/TolA-binding protein